MYFRVEQATTLSKENRGPRSNPSQWNRGASLSAFIWFWCDKSSFYGKDIFYYNFCATLVLNVLDNNLKANVYRHIQLATFAQFTLAVFPLKHMFYRTNIHRGSFWEARTNIYALHKRLFFTSTSFSSPDTGPSGVIDYWFSNIWYLE